MRKNRLGSSLLVASFLLLPASAWAQNVGVSGRVTDETGGVLPGVTVEARSPALIEQVRSTVTDGQGLFTITALRPGEYSVTFQLQGFSTFVREGVVLTGSAIAGPAWADASLRRNRIRCDHRFEEAARSAARCPASMLGIL